MDETKVTPRMREAVLRRDGYRCVAPQVDRQAGWCRDAFGNVITRWRHQDPGPVYLQVNHVKEPGELMMGKKTSATMSHLVALCPHHHTGTDAGSNWEARQRHLLRAYLGRVS